MVSVHGYGMELGVVGRESEERRGKGCMHTWTSKPAVKARSPAPVRTTDRTFGSCESLMKILERLCHILLAWALVWCFLEVW
jgi:hypothetical protein